MARGHLVAVNITTSLHINEGLIFMVRLYDKASDIYELEKMLIHFLESAIKKKFKKFNRFG